MRPRVGLMWAGDAEQRANADLQTSRFAKAATAIEDEGLEAVAVVFDHEAIDEVRAELLTLAAVQVWVNPIEGGRDRSELDSLLVDVAKTGVLVFTHPHTILKMGTKQVLYDTRGMSWGSDVAVYHSFADLRAELPARLSAEPRVLKQYRGHSGGGIWKVEQRAEGLFLRHAQRGCVAEPVSFEEVVTRMEPYFAAYGRMIDQAYQPRLAEGMTRVYMVGSVVAGFGHQEVNAFFPPPPGAPEEDAPPPGPRLYYPPDEPRFSDVKLRMEQDWVQALPPCLGMTPDELPLLWDADLLLGAVPGTYVLCEINVSSVSPYPEWANPILAHELRRRVGGG